MRRRVAETIRQGHKPEKIVAVVGAFHAPVINGDIPEMTEEELSSLPKRSSKLTLMPYSYFKLSSQSGYGAGNHAPAYFELLWQSPTNASPVATAYSPYRESCSHAVVNAADAQGVGIMSREQPAAAPLAHYPATRRRIAPRASRTIVWASVLS